MPSPTTTSHCQNIGTKMSSKEPWRCAVFELFHHRLSIWGTVWGFTVWSPGQRRCISLALFKNPNGNLCDRYWACYVNGECLGTLLLGKTGRLYWDMHPLVVPWESSYCFTHDMSTKGLPRVVEVSNNLKYLYFSRSGRESFERAGTTFLHQPREVAGRETEGERCFYQG